MLKPLLKMVKLSKNIDYKFQIESDKMPRLDIHHKTVRNALEKDGWVITHDPFLLQIGKKRLFADLGAEIF